MLNSRKNNAKVVRPHFTSIEEMANKNEVLKKHESTIWYGTDNRWTTNIYIKDMDGNVTGRKILKSTDRFKLEEKICKFYEEHPEQLYGFSALMDDVFEEWSAWKLNLNKVSESTMDRYSCDYKRFFGEFGKTSMSILTEDDCIDFLEEQLAKYNLTAKAFRNLKTLLKGILKYAKRRKMINFQVESVFFNLEVTDHDYKKVIKEDSEEVFDVDETKKMMSYLINSDDIRDKGILLMFLTGARIGELVTLKIKDVDGLTIKIRRTESKKKVDGKWKVCVKEYPKTEAGVRSLIVPKEYEDFLHKIVDGRNAEEFIFTMQDSVYDGHMIQEKRLRRRFNKILKELGIIHKTPHKVRKTYGTILLDNNLDKNLVTTVMGHTDISMTEKSYHRNRKEVDKKIEIISALPEFKMNYVS